MWPTCVSLSTRKDTDFLGYSLIDRSGSVTNYPTVLIFYSKQSKKFHWTSLLFQMKTSCGAFRVLCDGYVTADNGTGIVHQAPAFGEVSIFIRIHIVKKSVLLVSGQRA